jgi:hypothetical protein
MLARLLDAGSWAPASPPTLDGPEGLERLGPVLETLERRGAPLFVHPGPAAVTMPRCRAGGRH